MASLASDVKYTRHCAKSLDGTRKMKLVRMLSLAETRVYYLPLESDIYRYPLVAPWISLQTAEGRGVNENRPC